ncbi:hypothetical protein GCM10025863_15120 [Microbacterium suwonense]|uniref:N-acetylmuramoyl-L-alanine amidase n=1 Tax=Microbacterium suwonense TaxID=683047 RepID=A0ABM8FTQ4_9MICO|nr:hypothetical protein GCM10025863_15120 [Microbacterium suwonense]
MGGESSREVLRFSSAVATAPEVELYVNLHLEARRERQEDSRYFKLWAVLETIAINEVPDGAKVFLDDGSQWPDGGTTSQGAELHRMASELGITTHGAIGVTDRPATGCLSFGISRGLPCYRDLMSTIILIRHAQAAGHETADPPGQCHRTTTSLSARRAARSHAR